jgi:hypothetical protein
MFVYLLLYESTMIITNIIIECSNKGKYCVDNVSKEKIKK